MSGNGKAAPKDGLPEYAVRGGLGVRGNGSPELGIRVSNIRYRLRKVRIACSEVGRRGTERRKVFRGNVISAGRDQIRDLLLKVGDLFALCGDLRSDGGDLSGEEIGGRPVGCYEVFRC